MILSRFHKAARLGMRFVALVSAVVMLSAQPVSGSHIAKAEPRANTSIGAMGAVAAQDDFEQAIGAPAMMLVNPKSEPVVGGAWDLHMLLAGRATLEVSPVWPTRLRRPDEPSGGGHDLEFMRATVGGKRVEMSWNGYAYAVPVDQATGEAVVSFRVLTRGPHELRLRFGESEQIARNSAIAIFSEVSTATSGLITTAGHSMVFADFNGDGYPDIARTDAADAAASEVRLFLNDQDGTFTQVNGFATNCNRGLTFGDFNHDGFMDLVAVARTGNDRIRALSNNGNGTSWSSQSLDDDGDPKTAALLDVNGDGLLDIWAPSNDRMYHNRTAAGGWNSNNGLPGVDHRNNGDGATAADFNNDGRLGLIWNRTGSVCRAYTPNAAFSSYSSTNNINSGGTPSGLPQDVGDHTNMDWAWGDFDNDGDVDVFISGDAGVGLYRNNGSGAFTNVSGTLGVSVTATTTGAAWGDYDNDGNLDLVVSRGGTAFLYRNNGPNATLPYSFMEVAVIAGITSLTGTVGFCDFDLDGDLDLVSITGNFWRNNLSGTAQSDYLRVQPIGAGGTTSTQVWSPRTAIGARVQLFDRTGATLIATRWVDASQGNLQPWNFVTFGVDPDEEYLIRVRFPTSQLTVEVTSVVPRLLNTQINTSVLTQTLAVYENSQSTYSGLSGNPWGTMILYGEGTSNSNIMQRSYDSINNVMEPAAIALETDRQTRWFTRPTQDAKLHIITIITEWRSGGAAGTRTRYRAFRYNGQIWQTDWIDGDFAERSSQIRSVDCVTMAVSGDVMCVYSDGSNDNPFFRVFSNGSWTAAARIYGNGSGDGPGNSAVEWVRLAADPGSNDIWLVYSTANRDLYAKRWDGSDWVAGAQNDLRLNTDTGNSRLKSNTSTGNVSLQCHDVAFEQSSRDVLVCWGPNNQNSTLLYRTKSVAGNWSGQSSMTVLPGNNAVERRANTVKLLPDPRSDRIVVGFASTNGTSRLGGAMWTGTDWQSHTGFTNNSNGGYPGVSGVADGRTFETTALADNQTRAQSSDFLDMAWLFGMEQGQEEVYMLYNDDGTDNDIDWAKYGFGHSSNQGYGWYNQTDVNAANFSEPRSSLSWPNLDGTRAVSLVANDVNQRRLFLVTYNPALHAPSGANNPGLAIGNGGVALTNDANGLSTNTIGTAFTLFSPRIRTGIPGLWTGAVSDDWSNPANWDDGSVPTGIPVTIPTGTPFSPKITRPTIAVTTVSIAAGATLEINASGTLTTTGNINVNGNLIVDAASTTTLGNNAVIAISSTGTLQTRASDSSTPSGAATFTAANPATGQFSITVATGGTLDMKGAAINAGRIIPQDNVTMRLSDVSFSNLPTGTTNFMDLTNLQSGTVNLRKLNFDRGNNVTAANARNILVGPNTLPLTVFGTGGNMGGELFDADANNLIHWQNNCIGLQVSGTTFWPYQRAITIDEALVGRGGVSDFPVLVTVTDPAMVSKAQADGDDFRFLSASGVKLDHEIEQWDTTTGTLAAWVKVPSISDRIDTLIYLQYGNPNAGNQQNVSAVWDADHVLVWHMSDTLTGGGADQVIDSSGNNRHGTAIGLTNVTTERGLGANWIASGGGTNRRIRYITGLNWHPTTSITYEAWVRINQGTARSLFSYASGTSDNAVRLHNQSNFNPYIRGTNGGNTGTSVNDGNWHHVAYTWNSTEGIARIFIDGVASGAVSGLQQGNTIGIENGAVVLGQDQDSVDGGFSPTEAWIGDMDEFRISSINRSEAWITTTYNNGANPAAFASVGLEETVTPNLIDIRSYLPGAGETLTVRANVVDSQGDPLLSLADHRGVLQLGAFLGTINIDGIRFSPASTASGISVAAGATGTVNFYNCAFVDPGNGRTTAANGTARALVTKSGSTTLNAFYCTLDSNTTLGTNGFSVAATTTNVHTFSMDAATRTSHFVDYNNRNLRPTHAMLTDAAFQATRDATYTRDLDGRERTAGANATRRGAWEGMSTSAMTVGQSDITNGTGTGNRIIFNSIPANNTAGQAIYIAGSDGTNCYLSVLSRTNLTVQHVASWTGTLAGFVTFIQTNDQATQYWLYIPYDSDGNGTFDRIRRIKHTVGTGLSGSTDQVMTNSAGGAIDFNTNGGWSGQFSLQNTLLTGVLSGEIQVSLATPAGDGGLHVWYVNRASTAGTFWPTAALNVNSGRASESYYGAPFFRASPNPFAQPMVSGSAITGTALLAREVDATSDTSLIMLSRNIAGTGIILNSYTGPTALGEGISNTPFALFQAGARISVQRTDTNQALLLQWPTLTAETLTVPGLTGFGGVWGVPPVGFFGAEVQFMPFTEIDGCHGAVAAVEYKSDQDGGGTYDLMTGTYAYQGGKYQYHVPGTPGSFRNGVARVVGKPTRLAYAPTPATNTVIFCATDAGLLYCWTAHGLPASSDALPKGRLINGFPIRIEGGRIVSCNFVSLSDTTLRAAINLPAGTGNALAVFTDRGQVILVRTPETAP